MSNGHGPKIEDLPPEAQIPVLIRELLALTRMFREHKTAADSRLEIHDARIKDMELWRARVMGQIALSAAIGAAVASLVTIFIGKAL